MKIVIYTKPKDLEECLELIIKKYKIIINDKQNWLSFVNRVYSHKKYIYIYVYDDNHGTWGYDVDRYHPDVDVYYKKLFKKEFRKMKLKNILKLKDE